MRQNGPKNGLSQQITPGVTDTTDVETKGKCKECSVPEAVASTGQVRASVRRRRHYDDSDDSDSCDEELATPPKKPCGCGTCKVEEEPALTQPTKNPDGTVSVSVGSYENYNRFDNTQTTFNFPTLEDYENSAVGSSYRRKHHRLGRGRRCRDNTPDCDRPLQRKKSCDSCKPKPQIQRPPMFSGNTPNTGK